MKEGVSDIGHQAVQQNDLIPLYSMQLKSYNCLNLLPGD